MVNHGILASSGAQLDFSFLEVANYSVGKGTAQGFLSGTGGTMSNQTLEFGNHTACAVQEIEDEGTQIRFRIQATPLPANNDKDAFKRIIIGDLTLNRSDAEYSSGSWVWDSTDDVLSGNVGNTIIVELRSD